VFCDIAETVIIKILRNKKALFMGILFTMQRCTIIGKNDAKQKLNPIFAFDGKIRPD
jgi:hypothetical protein